MPNTIDANGLTVKTYDEVTTDLEDGLSAAYGADINLDSNSPDGQMVGIFTKAILDVLELLIEVYNSFSVANAFGVTLHERVALNGIVPKVGTYTTTPVAITIDQALTLYGLDELGTNPDAIIFTVKDSTVEWQLVSTYVFGAPGTQSLVFQAVPLGPTTPIPNTITNQVTPIIGVTNVNNPSITGAVIGLAEESDVSIKIRHGKSFTLASDGPADAVNAALLNLATVDDALVLENVTASTDSDGIPAHAIWAIVRGGVPADIGGVIYSKKSSGCGMKGGQSIVISRPNGQSFTAKWDDAVAERLYARFTIVPKIPGLTFDFVLLAQEVAAAVEYKIGQVATLGDIVIAMATIEPRAILIDVGVSNDGMTYTDSLDPTLKLNYFTLDAGDIAIT